LIKNNFQKVFQKSLSNSESLKNVKNMRNVFMKGRD